MIKYIKIFFMLVMLLPFMSSCDWKELPAYEEADITGIQFRYRWASDSKDAITGEPVVKEIQLGANATINVETGTIDVVVTVPAASANFPASARDATTQSKLWAQVTLSTAARLFPIAFPKEFNSTFEFIFFPSLSGCSSRRGRQLTVDGACLVIRCDCFSYFP